MLNNRSVLVIRYEADRADASLYVVNLGSGDIRKERDDFPPCDTRRRPDVASVLTQYLSRLQGECKLRRPDYVVVTSPGAMSHDNKALLKASRLGVMTKLELARLLFEHFKLDCYLFNDTIALAIGEARFGVGKGLDFHFDDSPVGDADFACIAAGLGVGSAIFMNGKLYKGAGAAGHIGRMMIDPTGPLHAPSHSRGNLEVYTSREWMVRHVMSESHHELEKEEEAELRKQPYYRFRQQILVAEDPISITMEMWSQALQQGDPLVKQTTDDSARFLGLAVSAMLTFCNPPYLVLGGELVDILPGFYQAVYSYAKRFTYSLPWRHSRLLQAALGQEAQLIGACQLLLSKLRGHDA